MIRTEKYFDGEQELELKIFSARDKHYFNSQNQRHRADGPAAELSSGSKFWFKNDKQHRLDGPAVEYADGSKRWYIEGKEVNCSSQEEFERYLKVLILK